ncbi:phosphate/phosphite/phosphonate ABC transporter substrate-binding protein [Thermodesulfobacteriota bacterium]
MRKTSTYILITLLLFASLFACEKEQAKEISLSQDEIIPTPPNSEQDGTIIRIAIAAIISPRETFSYYEEFLSQLSKKMGAEIKLIQRKNYAEINNLVEAGKIDVAFVCSGAYVDGHNEFGMELLVAPQAYGEPYYYSYIIVPSDSDVTKLADLKGKKFAFTDPMSNSGKLAPTYLLSKMNETPNSFFSKHIFTYSHDKSIEAVAQKLVDGAAVDSLIWEYANAVDPTFTKKTKVILKSAPFGIPPVVVAKDIDPKLKKELKEVFLNMHFDKNSKPILDKLHIDKFIIVEDSAYNSIREMKEFINDQK